MSGLCLCQQHDLHRPKFLSSRYSCKSSFAINTHTHTQPEHHVRALCCSCRRIVILLCQTRMIEMFVNPYCVSLQQHNTDFHLEIIPSGWNDLSFSCLMILYVWWCICLSACYLFTWVGIMLWERWIAQVLFLQLLICYKRGQKK